MIDQFYDHRTRVIIDKVFEKEKSIQKELATVRREEEA